MSVVESPALELRTKQCANCGRLKPWGDFHAKTKWPDGTMRQPHAYCRRCFAEYVRAYQARRRRDDSEFRERIESNRSRRRQEVKANDPERYAVLLDYHRQWKRKRYGFRRVLSKYERGAIPRVTSHDSLVSDPQPFIDWLRTLGSNAEEIGFACGIDGAQVRKYLSGTWSPTERTVDRAVQFAEQTYKLEELIPLKGD